MHGDRLDPDKIFKKKPDSLSARIKSVNERVPAPDDAGFRQNFEHMTGFLLGEGTLGAPPQRDTAVITDLIREMAGSNVQDLQRILWQSNISDWQGDPNFYNAVGLLFATKSGDNKAAERLTTGLLG